MINRIEDLREQAKPDDSLPSNTILGMNMAGLPTALFTEAVQFDIHTGQGNAQLQPVFILKPWENNEDGQRLTIVKFLINGMPALGIPMGLAGVKRWRTWFAALEEAMTPKEPEEPEKMIEEPT